jgi:hypothetical protein
LLGDGAERLLQLRNRDDGVVLMLFEWDCCHR